MNAWETALDVVHRCLRAGVGEFVICAGARNAALIEALARAEAAGLVRLWRHFEERSAGFFALGRTMETGQPCAVVTTSGTAAAELLPPRDRGVLSGPAAGRAHRGPPRGLPRNGRAARRSSSRGFSESTRSKATLSEWDGKGPLHLQRGVRGSLRSPGDEDFSSGNGGHLSLRRKTASMSPALARWLREDLYRGIVVMVGGLEPDEREEVFHFCRDFGAPVVAEATSGLREALHGLAIHDADRVLKARPPGKILRLGEVPSGRFWRDLEDLPQVSVWSICRNGLPGLARESQVTRGPAGPRDPRARRRRTGR